MTAECTRDAQFPHLPPSKAVVLKHWTLVSDELISVDRNSGQYKATFKCNIVDGDGKVCGADRSILHYRGKVVSTTNLIRHVADMTHKCASHHSNPQDWEANAELEAFLSYPFEIKDTIEHKKECTGAQSLMFLYDLKDNYCNKDARLEVKLLPQSLKLKHRERSVEQREASSRISFV